MPFGEGGNHPIYRGQVFHRRSDEAQPLDSRTAGSEHYSKRRAIARIRYFAHKDQREIELAEFRR